MKYIITDQDDEKCWCDTTTNIHKEGSGNWEGRFAIVHTEQRTVLSDFLRKALTAHSLASTQKFADEVLALKLRYPLILSDDVKQVMKAHGLKVTD